MNGLLEGKTTLVTGAAGGIGSMIARTFVAQGAKVAVTDLDPASVTGLADELRTHGDVARGYRHDVTSEADWQAVTKAVQADWGPIDILVNNAGIFKHSSIEDMPLELFELICKVNLSGTFLGTKYAIRSMKTRSRDKASASIVNMSSVVGLIGSPFASIYSMTKGGVRLFTKSTALEVAQLGYNIRCNSIHPGVVETAMAGLVAQRIESTGVDPAQIPGMLKAQHPLGRLGQPQDIAEAALYLASDMSSFVTGTELVVDGGWTAR